METTFEIARIHRPSREEFERRFLAPGIPVVITGAMADWPALERWTPGYLKERAGDRTIRVSTAHRGVHFYDGKEKILDYSTIKLREYVDLIAAERLQDGRLYASVVPVQKALPELWEDLRYPPYFDSAASAPPNLWYGPGNNVSPLHYDSTHNFLTQVRGHKKVVLHPPREIENLYPHPMWYAAHHVSRINVLDPDHQRFPAYRRASSGVAHLAPGDMLFIPLFWWHAVFGLDENMSVNYWWRTSITSYLKHPRQTARGLCGLTLVEAARLLKSLKQRRRASTVDVSGEKEVT